VVSKNVRRHRLISSDYLTTLPVTAEVARFESRSSPAILFKKSCTNFAATNEGAKGHVFLRPFLHPFSSIRGRFLTTLGFHRFDHSYASCAGVRFRSEDQRKDRCLRSVFLLARDGLRCRHPAWIVTKNAAANSCITLNSVGRHFASRVEVTCVEMYAIQIVSQSRRAAPRGGICLRKIAWPQIGFRPMVPCARENPSRRIWWCTGSLLFHFASASKNCWMNRYGLFAMLQSCKDPPLRTRWSASRSLCLEQKLIVSPLQSEQLALSKARWRPQGALAFAHVNPGHV